MVARVFPVATTTTVLFDGDFRLLRGAMESRLTGVLPTKRLPKAEWGVSSTNGQELKPYGDSTGMQIKVKPGYAFIMGDVFHLDSEKTVTIAAADPSNPRIDAVVIEQDFIAYTSVIKMVTGTPATSPSLPALVQTLTKHQFLLGYVKVGSGATTISAANVADAREYAAPRHTISVNFGGINAVVETTAYCADIPIDQDFYITEVELIGDQTGSISVDVWNDTTFPTTVADTICNTTYPAISSALRSVLSRDYLNYLNGTASLLSWTRLLLEEGSYVAFDVITSSTTEQVHVNLHGYLLGIGEELY